MVENEISIAKLGHLEKTRTYPTKYVYPIPRTRDGWEEKKYVYLDFGTNHKVSLLTRKVENFCLPALNGFDFAVKPSFSETYSIAWKTLKDRGFVVVPTVRIVDTDTVATTNLSVDEVTSIYDQKIDAAEVRDTFPMDKFFMDIPLRKLQQAADNIVGLANKSGVELMSDGPFHIVVNGDGSWYLILLDIGKVRIYNKPNELPKSSVKDNVFYVNKAMTAFARIQKNIRSLREARVFT